MFFKNCRSKLPAANSRSGSTEGHGASGDLFAMRGAVGRVRVFFEVGCEKMAEKIEKSFRFQSIFLNSSQKRGEKCDQT